MMLHSSDPTARYKTKSDDIPDLSSGAGPGMFARHTQSNATAENPAALIPPFKFFSGKSFMVPVLMNAFKYMHKLLVNQYFLQI